MFIMGRFFGLFVSLLFYNETKLVEEFNNPKSNNLRFNNKEIFNLKFRIRLIFFKNYFLKR